MHSFDFEATQRNLVIDLKESSYTVIELSEKLGLSYQAVARWYSGERFPSFDHFAALLNALNLRCEDVVVIKELDDEKERIK